MLTCATGRPTASSTRGRGADRGPHRHPQIVTVKSGVRDGKFTAIERRSREHGAYAGPRDDRMSVTWQPRPLPLPLPDSATRPAPCTTNLAVAGAFRGYGCPQGFSPSEATWTRWGGAGRRSAGFRTGTTCRRATTAIAGSARRGQGGFKQIIRSCGLPQAIQLGAKAIGWTEKRKRFGAKADLRWLRDHRPRNAQARANHGQRERADSLPTRARGVWGVRRSTPRPH